MDSFVQVCRMCHSIGRKNQIILVSLAFHFRHDFLLWWYTTKWNQNQREKPNSKTQSLSAWIGSFEVIAHFYFYCCVSQFLVASTAKEIRIFLYQVKILCGFWSWFVSARLICVRLIKYHLNGWQSTLKIISICIILSFSCYFGRSKFKYILFRCVSISFSRCFVRNLDSNTQYTLDDFYSYTPSKMSDIFLCINCNSICIVLKFFFLATQVHWSITHGWLFVNNSTRTIYKITEFASLLFSA